MSDDAKPPEPELALEPPRTDHPHQTGLPGFKEPEQMDLLTVDPGWKELWKGMPDFEQRDESPWQTIPVHVRNRDDRKKLAALLGQTITDDTRSLWFPKAEMLDAVTPAAEELDQDNGDENQ